MQLTLDPIDLKPEHQTGLDTRNINPKISANQTSFDTFPEDVQAAIVAVGGAVYYAWDHMTYNPIMPPKQKG